MRPVLRTILASLVATALVVPAAGSAHARTGEGPDAVLAWNAVATSATVAACFSPGADGNPIAESRLFAMTQVAVHDALNGIRHRYQPYAARLSAWSKAAPDAAIAAAAHDVLVPGLAELSTFLPASCIDAGTAVVEEAYTAALAAIPDGRAKAAGIGVGRQAAAAIRELRAHDGSDTLLQDTGYPQGTEPGAYHFTPGTPFAFAPGWADVTPFVLRDGAQYRPGPPYPVTSRRYAADVAEVQRLGGDGVTTPSDRTAEQTEIALFWVGSVPAQWNGIARTVTRQRNLDPWQAARLFGLVNLAVADGYIATFDTKYHYNFWRPVTAIRLADTDGNPATTADPNWTPLVTTPPVPEYDSGHSVTAAAAAAVLTGLLGRVAFAACSGTVPDGSRCDDAHPVVRLYTSFGQASRENQLSRIYVGFHFRDAVDTGGIHGTKIGELTLSTSLRPS
jgi:hypothetical protein